MRRFTAERPPAPDAAMAAYRPDVEEASDQAEPVFLVALKGARHAAALPMWASPFASPRDTIEFTTGAVERGILARPDWVLFFSESWMAVSDNPASLENLERGELAERAAIGMTGVEEAAIVNMVAADGSAWSAIQRFTRNRALGAVVWGELEIFTDRDSPGGAIIDALSRMVGRETR